MYWHVYDAPFSVQFKLLGEMLALILLAVLAFPLLHLTVKLPPVIKRTFVITGAGGGLEGEKFMTYTNFTMQLYL